MGRARRVLRLRVRARLRRKRKVLPQQNQRRARRCRPAAACWGDVCGEFAQKPADGGAQTEPQMQDQSAPVAESLGEAARRARAQKAGAAKRKVFTDDSVTTLSGHGVSVVGAGNGAGGGASYGGNWYAGVPPSAAGNNQEAYWRGRANARRSQMAACDQRISEIQDEIAKHGAVSVDPMSGAQAARFRGGPQRADQAGGASGWVAEPAGGTCGGRAQGWERFWAGFGRRLVVLSVEIKGTTGERRLTQIKPGCD